ncbi:hypothetical protein O3P69_000122 [Scylla paramamosain]|uniref:Uncharacterized protein n=1 Tax=Scylla paramamosain TaxID=85552 RepID=A0AAW0UV95_SCYPA
MVEATVVVVMVVEGVGGSGAARGYGGGYGNQKAEVPSISTRVPRCFQALISYSCPCLTVQPSLCGTLQSSAAPGILSSGVYEEASLEQCHTSPTLDMERRTLLIVLLVCACLLASAMAFPRPEPLPGNRFPPPEGDPVP